MRAEPGEVIRRSKQIEYGKGPQGQSVVSSIDEREWIEGVTPEPPREHERRVVAAVQKTAGAIASQAVANAAPQIIRAATRAVLQALPQPADGLSATEYWRQLQDAYPHVVNEKIHVGSPTAKADAQAARMVRAGAEHVELGARRK